MSLTEAPQRRRYPVHGGGGDGDGGGGGDGAGSEAAPLVCFDSSPASTGLGSLPAEVGVWAETARTPRYGVSKGTNVGRSP